MITNINPNFFPDITAVIKCACTQSISSIQVECERDNNSLCSLYIYVQVVLLQSMGKDTAERVANVFMYLLAFKPIYLIVKFIVSTD